MPSLEQVFGMDGKEHPISGLLVPQSLVDLLMEHHDCPEFVEAFNKSLAESWAKMTKAVEAYAEEL